MLKILNTILFLSFPHLFEISGLLLFSMASSLMICLIHLLKYQCIAALSLLVTLKSMIERPKYPFKFHFESNNMISLLIRKIWILEDFLFHFYFLTIFI